MRIRKALGKPIALTLLIALVVGVMIGIGFGKQGLQFFSDRFAPGSGNARQALSGQLSVLALKGVFSKTFLTEFKTRTGVEIVLTEASEPEALWAQFESPGKGTNFDVITLMSYQVPAAVQLVRLQVLDESKINLALVHPDFLDIRGDPTHNRLVPVLWGATGFVYRAKSFPEPPQSWQDVLKRSDLKGRIGLLAFPIALAHLLRSRQPDATTSGQNQHDDDSELGPSDELIKKGLKPVLEVVTVADNALSAGELLSHPNQAVVEMNSGESAFVLGQAQEMQGWKFVLPKEGAPLWILSLALTQATKAEPAGYALLNYLLETENAAAFCKETRQASTVQRIESLNLPAPVKPSYLRKIPLTELTVLHDFQGANAVHAALRQEDQ